MGLVAAPSLRQFALKIKFFMSSSEFGCSAQALEAIVAEGLPTLSTASTGDGASLELWFRTIVHEAWRIYLKSPTAADDIAARVLHLNQDAEAFGEVLRPICDNDETASRVLRPVCEDIGALAVLTRVLRPDEEALAVDERQLSGA